MKRLKKPAKKSGPVEESSNNSDMVADPKQCSTRAQGKKQAAHLLKPADKSDSSEVPLISTKKANLKRKETPGEPSLISEADEAPTPPIKKGKAKVQESKAVKFQPVSDSDEKTTQPLRPGKGKAKNPTPVQEPMGESSSDTNKQLPLKTGKGKAKKPLKVPEPTGESSTNSGEESTQRLRTGRRKAKKPSKMPEQTEEFPKILDEESTQSMKTGKGKAKKQSKATESNEDSSNDADVEDKSIQTSKTAAGKAKKSDIKSTRQKAPSEPTSDSDEEPAQPSKTGRRRTKKLTKSAPMGDSSNDSDDEPAQPSKTGTIRTMKNTKVEPMDDSSNDSDDEPAVPLKNGNGKYKKQLKAPMDESSSDSEGPRQVLNSGKKPAKEPVKRKPQRMLDKATASILSKWCAGDGQKYDPEITAMREQHDKAETQPSDDSDSDDASKSAKAAARDAEEHLCQLDQLSRVDKEFHSFLLEHDKELLNFDAHENALDDEDRSDVDEEVHVPGEIHGGSDESDFEAEDAVQVKGKVTLKMVKDLAFDLSCMDAKIQISTFTYMIKLFHAAVLRATSADGSSEGGEFKVAGSSVFNAVVQTCVIYMPDATKAYLGIDKKNPKEPQKCKRFVKIKGILIQYLTDVLNLISAVTSEQILGTLLKHLHQMAVFVACFMRVTKQALRKLIVIWSTGEEIVRVIAFLCILRITLFRQDELLENVLKAMYMTYIKNCKFVSPTTWPAINFMRRSLVEMFMLNLDVSYRLAFLYIRQLGIHLRNAIVVKRLENIQAVYNWQYINSLHLWAQLLQTARKHADIQTLLFPLTMIISYTIELVPTPQYFPVRFLLTDILMKMTISLHAFIPVLRYMLDVFPHINYKKNKTASMKPLDFSCIIRLSKSQLNETGFNDTVVDKLYALILEYTASFAHSIAFPDINVVVIMNLKNFISKCTVPNHVKKMKQLLEKIEENSELIYKKRLSNPSLYINNVAVDEMQNSLKQGPNKPPLLVFYENWVKVNKIQKRKDVTQNDVVAGKMPMIRRTELNENQLYKVSDENFPLDLFPSDNEDDNTGLFGNENDENSAPKPNKKKKMKKQQEAQQQVPVAEDTAVADTGDIVQELRVNDW